eukprot:Rmarinus@m.25349
MQNGLPMDTSTALSNYMISGSRIRRLLVWIIASSGKGNALQFCTWTFLRRGARKGPSCYTAIWTSSPHSKAGRTVLVLTSLLFVTESCTDAVVLTMGTRCSEQ